MIARVQLRWRTACTALRGVIFGGIDIPLRWSRYRLPFRETSTVTTSASAPMASSPGRSGSRRIGAR